MRKLVLLLSVLALAAFGLAACGGDDDDEEPTVATETEEPTAPAGGGGGGAETVDVSADPGGDLAFQESSLEAPSGSVTFNFDNPAAIAHDFCLEQDGQDLGCSDTISEDSSELGAELEPGTYTYYCSVAGHREAGMEGELRVK